MTNSGPGPRLARLGELGLGRVDARHLEALLLQEPRVLARPAAEVEEALRRGAGEDLAQERRLALDPRRPGDQAAVGEAGVGVVRVGSVGHPHEFRTSRGGLGISRARSPLSSVVLEPLRLLQPACRSPRDRDDGKHRDAGGVVHGSRIPRLVGEGVGRGGAAAAPIIQDAVLPYSLITTRCQWNRIPASEALSPRSLGIHRGTRAQYSSNGSAELPAQEALLGGDDGEVGDEEERHAHEVGHRAVPDDEEPEEDEQVADVERVAAVGEEAARSPAPRRRPSGSGRRG